MHLGVLTISDVLKVSEAEATLAGLPIAGEVANPKVLFAQEPVRSSKARETDRSIGTQVVKQVHNLEQG